MCIRCGQEDALFCDLTSGVIGKSNVPLQQQVALVINIFSSINRTVPENLADLKMNTKGHLAAHHQCTGSIGCAKGAMELVHWP